VKGFLGGILEMAENCGCLRKNGRFLRKFEGFFDLICE
jgi:hypothetical protein